MKKLLIIQQDEAYFLFETIRVLETHRSAFKDFEVTLFSNEQAHRIVFDATDPTIKNITFNAAEVLSNDYDLSVNLSLSEISWDIHGKVRSNHKIGTYRLDGQTFVEDLWSTYLLTMKAKAPFLTFHMRDIYKNILGIKSAPTKRPSGFTFNTIAYGACASHLFSGEEQEQFINGISKRFPLLTIKDVSEVDLFEDVSHILYIGPATLNALKLCDAGAKGIFLSSSFQGFNLLPYDAHHNFLSSRGKSFESTQLLNYLEGEISSGAKIQVPYAVYTITHDNMSGAYLQSLNGPDDNYPFYQSHVVLWNFLLNLHDTNLDITKCSQSQVYLLKSQHDVLSKLIRFHDYAMTAIDTIYQESKKQISDATRISECLEKLQEIENVSDHLAGSQAYLRPVIDFYRIRRGQNMGETLEEQAQNSYLVYNEEHQALEALQELFSVTLKENAVNI